MHMQFRDMDGLSGSEKFQLMKLLLEMEIEKEKQLMERERIKASMGIDVRETKDGDKRVKYVPEFVGGEEENFFLQFEKNCKVEGVG